MRGWRVGGPVSESRVTLRVQAPSLDGEAVSALLGRKPTELARVEPDTVWVLRCDLPDSLRAELKLYQFVSSLPADSFTWERLAVLGRASIFLGLFMESDNEGLHLDAELLASLAEKSIALDVDIYGWSEA